MHAFSVVSDSAIPFPMEGICPEPQEAPKVVLSHRVGLMSIESVMPSSHLILCRPLLLLPPMQTATSKLILFSSFFDKSDHLQIVEEKNAVFACGLFLLVL